MRLLIVQGGFGPGGAEKNVALLAGHRHALGDELHVMGFDAPPGGSYFPYPDRVRLVFAQPGQRQHPLARLVRIRQEIALVQPDLILSFLTKINVLTLLAASRTNCPVVISERNNPKAQNAHPAWRHLQTLLARRAQGVVLQTKRARATWPTHLQGKIHVIPNPSSPIDRPLRMPSYHHVNLVAVGRLDRQKGFDTLLRAMPTIHAACPGTRLTIHGEGPERTRLERLRDALDLQDCVALPGTSADPGSWLRDADLLLAPSRFEGFPNVLAEAVVSGLPVIASDCDFGPREIIRTGEPPGENGCLVPVDNVQALARATINLLRDRPRMVQMQRATALSRRQLSPDRVLAQWDAVIEHTASNGGITPRSTHHDQDAESDDHGNAAVSPPGQEHYDTADPNTSGSSSNVVTR